MSDSLPIGLMLVNMAVQTVILILLIYGFYHLRATGDRRRHGIIFSIATILNLISVVAVMIPSLYYGWNDVAQNLSRPDAFITITHHLIGLLVVALSLIIAVSWGNRNLPNWDQRGKIGKGCLGEGRSGKALMRVTFALWVVSFILGAIIYGSLVMGIRL